MATLAVRDMCATLSEQHAAIADALPAKPRTDKQLPAARDSISAGRLANCEHLEDNSVRLATKPRCAIKETDVQGTR